VAFAFAPESYDSHQVLTVNSANPPSQWLGRGLHPCASGLISLIESCTKFTLVVGRRDLSRRSRFELIDFALPPHFAGPCSNFQCLIPHTFVSDDDSGFFPNPAVDSKHRSSGLTKAS